MKKIFITLLLFSFAASTLQAAGLSKTPNADPTTDGSGDGTDQPDPTGGTDQPDTEDDPNAAIVDGLLAQAAGELEPNNHITSANPITPNKPATGQLYAKDDEDWFYIQTTANNEVLTIEMPIQQQTWTVSIRDHAGNLFASRDSFTDRELSFTTTLLSPETYYIVIKSTLETDTRDPYVFTARATNFVDPSDPATDSNFFDAEIEPNDIFSQSNLISSAVTTVGQLVNGRDRDVYRIESDGNEILSIELCPQNSACSAQQSTEGGGPWVLLVLDEADVNDGTLTQTVDLDIFTKETKQFVATAGSSSHPYLLFASGLLNPIGVIDPTFGNRTRVNIGIDNPGNYYVMVTPVLKRENGSVILVKDYGKTSLGQQPTVIDPTVTASDTSVNGNFALSGVIYDETKLETKIIVITFTSATDYEYSVTGSDEAQTSTISKTEQITSSIILTSAAFQGTFTAGDTITMSVTQGGVTEGDVKEEDTMIEWILNEPFSDDQYTFNITRTELNPTSANTLAAQLRAVRSTVIGDKLHIPVVDINGSLFSGDLQIFNQDGKIMFELIDAQPLN